MGEPFWVSETHSCKETRGKGEAQLSLVATRLSHWVGLWCEKSNPMTWCIMVKEDDVLKWEVVSKGEE